MEENTVVGGLGGAVAEELLESGITPGFYYRMGLRAGFSSVVGSQNYLRRQYNLDRDAIANRVRELCGVQYLVH